MAEGHRSGAEEAARLRYELSRLRAKRSVRLALLVSRTGRPRDVWRTLRGERVEADLDVIPPSRVTRVAHYPHLMVLSASERPPFGWAASHLRVEKAQDVRSAGGDLLVIDYRRDGAATGAAKLSSAAAEVGTRTVGLVTNDEESHHARGSGLDLVVGITPDGTPLAGADVAVPPWVDATLSNPLGWSPDAPPVTVAASDHAQDILEHLAAGHVVVCPNTPLLPADVRRFVVTSGSGANLPGDRHQLRASRHVLTQHEALPRFETIIESLGIPRRPPPRISVLLATNRPGKLEHAIRQVGRQSHSNLELVVILHGEGFDPDQVVSLCDGDARIRVVSVPANRCLGDALNTGLDAASGEFIAKMDDDDYYGQHHLSDLLLALRYSGADVVGRWANEVYVESEDRTVTQDLDRQERWAHHLPGATMLVRGDVLRRVRFRRVAAAVDTHLIRAIHAIGGSAYATHRYGFIRVRHGTGHTHATRDNRVGAVHARNGLDLSVLDL